MSDVCFDENRADIFGETLNNLVENAHVEVRKTELLIYKQPVVNSSTTVTEHAA